MPKKPNQKLFGLKKLGNNIFGPYGNLKEAIQKSYSESEKGDIILFSPGFTSFAMFENEFDRGRQFAYEIEALRQKKKKEQSAFKKTD